MFCIFKFQFQIQRLRLEEELRGSDQRVGQLVLWALFRGHELFREPNYTIMSGQLVLCGRILNKLFDQFPMVLIIIIACLLAADNFLDFF